MADIKQNKIIIPDELPLIALKNTVLYPKVIIPLIVQRPKSVGALECALTRDRLVFFVTQRNTEDDIDRNDLYETGTIGRIVSAFKMPDGSSKVDVEGLVRAKIVDILDMEPFFRVESQPYNLIIRDNLEEKALLRRSIEQFRLISEARAFPAILPEVIYMMMQIKDTEHIISLMATNLNLDVDSQQKILEFESALDALRELLKSIEKELGVDDEKGDADILKDKISAAGMPKEVEDKAMKELNKLVKMPSFNPEVSYLRTYLDWLVELPWSKRTKEKINLKEAEKVLNEDHYGLKKVKERILEFLAVQKQVGKLKGPILCLVGPPGTGKTSIG